MARRSDHPDQLSFSATGFYSAPSDIAPIPSYGEMTSPKIEALTPETTSTRNAVQDTPTMDPLGAVAIAGTISGTIKAKEIAVEDPPEQTPRSVIVDRFDGNDSPKAPVESSESVVGPGDMNPALPAGTPQEKCANDFGDTTAQMDPQSAIGVLEVSAQAVSTPDSTSLPDNSVPTEAGDRETARKATRNKKPSRKSLLSINTGAEPMQARASTLYTALARAAGMSELDMQSPGLQVSLGNTVVEKVKDGYLEHDSLLQDALAAQAADSALHTGRDEYLASDRTRKRIERAMADLVEVGAVDIDDAGNPVTLHRLPEIKRLLAEHGVVNVRCRPGGKRLLCDTQGIEVHPEFRVKTSSPVQKAEPDDKAA